MENSAETQFEWNEHKREITLEKHGIDFKDAVKIFDGRSAVHVPLKYPDEPRWIVTGKLNNRLISVVYTLRNDKVRLITARRARTNEKRSYNNNHP